MTQDKLRVGVIGVGFYAVFAHIPQLRATGRVEITAISRRNAERLAMAQQALGVAGAYTDWRAMLDQASLDAVVVSTSHGAHAEPTLAALDRGLHVLVDKPMALTSRDAWSMVHAAERAGKVLMVACNMRTLGQWRVAKRTLAEGMLGRVRQIIFASSTFRRWIWQPDLPVMAEVSAFATSAIGLPATFTGDWQHWHADPTEMGGGTFADTGAHIVDLTLWLAGAHPVEVMAFSDPPGSPVEEFINVQARLSNGVLLSISSADADTQGWTGGEQKLLIMGDEGALTDDLDGMLWLSRHGTRTRLEPDAPDTSVAAQFVAAVCDGAPNSISGHEGAHAVELTEAAYRSALEGHVIRLS